MAASSSSSATRGVSYQAWPLKRYTNTIDPKSEPRVVVVLDASAWKHNKPEIFKQDKSNGFNEFHLPDDPKITVTRKDRERINRNAYTRALGHEFFQPSVGAVYAKQGITNLVEDKKRKRLNDIVQEEYDRRIARKAHNRKINELFGEEEEEDDVVVGKSLSAQEALDAKLDAATKRGAVVDLS